MKHFLLLTALFASAVHFAKAQNLSVKEDGNTVYLSNKLVTVSFNKTNADLNGIIYKGKSLLNGKDQRGYLLGPGFSMSPCQYKLVRHSDELIEVSFYHKAANHFQYDLHYVLMNGMPGVYCYLVQTHQAGDSTGDYGQTRWGIRSDENLFDYHLVRDSIQGPMPKMAALKTENTIQDWTFKMEDGTVYTKYNYADYIDGRHVHGMAGAQSGLGMFTIQASHEYLNGGPSKQYQNVHSNPYLINMFNCGHFLSDVRKGDNKISDAWQKVTGPFLLYLNDGKNIDAVWKDAKQQAQKEMNQWPYQWMQQKGYDLERGIVKGILQIDGKPAANATIVLSEPGYDWQAQSRSYIFSTHTNSKGAFELKNVRAGNYTLYAYGCNSTDEFKKENISTSKNKTTNLQTMLWQTEKNGTVLWQIGKADRRTTGFKLSNHKRSYGLFELPPADLTFEPGRDDEQEKWFYAQTKKGSWNVTFDINSTIKKTATLTIAIAGAAKNPLLEVWVNETKVAAQSLGNDAGIYRSATAGGYYQKVLIKFEAALLRNKGNTIALKLPNVKDGGGVMYDAIKLELE